MDTLTKILLISALAFTGILCGASLDQSLKQLPARHKIGMIAYSDYAKAADLKNGVWWYALIGIGSVLTTLLTAIVTWRNHLPDWDSPIYAAVLFSIGQVICTSQAAPLYFKQKNVRDAQTLEDIFKRFERIQTIRSVFIGLNFSALLWASYLII